MKIVFEFNMPEDKEDYEIHANALKIHAVLCDLQDEFRQKIKYGNPNNTDKFWSGRLQALLDERDVRL